MAVSIPFARSPAGGSGSSRGPGALPGTPHPPVSQLLLLGGRPCITKPTRTGRVASAPRAPASSALSSGKRTECETPRIREKLCGPGRKSLKTFLVQNHHEMGSVEATPAFPPCDALPAGVTCQGRHRLQAGQRLSFPRGRAQGAGDAKERRDGTRGRPPLRLRRPSPAAGVRPPPAGKTEGQTMWWLQAKTGTRTHPSSRRGKVKVAQEKRKWPSEKCWRPRGSSGRWAH